MNRRAFLAGAAGGIAGCSRLRRSQQIVDGSAIDLGGSRADAACPGSQFQPPSNTLFFGVRGQSNSGGRAALVPGDNGIQPNQYLYTNLGRWEPAQMVYSASGYPDNSVGGYGRYSTDDATLFWYGFHKAFAERIIALTGRPVGFVINSKTSKIEDWDWTVQNNTSIYYKSFKRFRNVPLHGIVWHQGEGNRLDDFNANPYTPKLKALFERFRLDEQPAPGVTTIPIVCGGITKNPNGVPGGGDAVNAQIAAIVGQLPAVAFASSETPSVLTTFDGLHFDRASYDALGTRLADAMAPML